MKHTGVFAFTVIGLCLVTILLLGSKTGGKGTFMQLKDFAELQKIVNLLQNVAAPLPSCKWDENILVGPLFVDEKEYNIEEIKNADNWTRAVKHGGLWNPTDCKAKAKVAIIVPFRNREKQLITLLLHLHPVLQRQKLDYRIFIINQIDRYPFNRAKLFNIGFKESLKYDSFDCFVFHDVDLIPEDDRNDYGCPSGPRHMCPAVNKFAYQLFSPYLFGGVTAFKKDDFMKVNGYANKYYGWGAEDDDMYTRIEVRRMKVRRPPLEVGRYTMIKHKDEERNSKAKRLLENAAKYMDKDGLNTLRYKVKARKSLDLYTQISVDVDMNEEEKKRTSLKILDEQKMKSS